MKQPEQLKPPCGQQAGYCDWQVDLFNEGTPQAHYAVTCYSPEGPMEVCSINPDIPLDHAKRIATRIATLCHRR